MSHEISVMIAISQGKVQAEACRGECIRKGFAKGVLHDRLAVDLNEVLGECLDLQQHGGAGGGI